MVRYSSAALTLIALLLSAPMTRVALGCATEVHSQSVNPKKLSSWAKYWNSKKVVRKPSSSSTDTSWSKDQLWGVQNSALWKPEAVLANAVSEALAAGYAEPGALDVLV